MYFMKREAILTCLFLAFLYSLYEIAAVFNQGNRVFVQWSQTVGNGHAFASPSIWARSSRPYLTVDSIGGRLGNQMFLYATLLGVAEAAYMRPVENAKARRVFLINNAFNLSSDVITTDETILNRDYERITELGNAIFTPEFMQPRYNDTMLVGDLQSYKYFHRISDRIRREFTFKAFVMEPARAWVSGLLANVSHWPGRGSSTTLIGLHARQIGMPAKSGFKVADVAYFKHAMAYYKQKYPDALFVASNSALSWVEQNLMVNRTDIVKMNNNSPPVDMAILSLCNHTLMSIGTFGWWAAWLAGGDVVYYSGHPRPGSDLDKRFCAEDHYPRHWIGMQ